MLIFKKRIKSEKGEKDGTPNRRCRNSSQELEKVLVHEEETSGLQLIIIVLAIFLMPVSKALLYSNYGKKEL